MPEYLRRKSAPVINTEIVVEEKRNRRHRASVTSFTNVTTELTSAFTETTVDGTEVDISSEEDVYMMVRHTEARRLALADIFDGVNGNDLNVALASYFEQEMMEELKSSLVHRRGGKSDIFEGLSFDDIEEVARCHAESDSCDDHGLTEVSSDLAKVLRVRRGARADVLAEVSLPERERLRNKTTSGQCQLGSSSSTHAYNRRGAQFDIFSNVEEDERTEFLLHYRGLATSHLGS